MIERAVGTIIDEEMKESRDNDSRAGEEEITARMSE